MRTGTLTATNTSEAKPELILKIVCLRPKRSSRFTAQQQSKSCRFDKANMPKETIGYQVRYIQGGTSRGVVILRDSASGGTSS